MIVEIEKLQIESSVLAAADSADRTVIDVAALRSRCMDDASIAQQLLGMFSQTVWQLAEQVELYVGQKKFRQAAELVHKLKGEAGSLSAVALHKAAGNLEDILRSSSPADANLATLRDEIHRFFTQLPWATKAL